ncbi:MAG: glycosyltransferase, partial [Steroidobacter sp.]
MKMCAALARNGHAATLFARRGSEEEPHAHYGTRDFDLHLCRNVQTPVLGAASYTAEVRSCLRSMPRFDVLYARHVYSLAAVASSGPPLIFEAHTPPA